MAENHLFMDEKCTFSLLLTKKMSIFRYRLLGKRGGNYSGPAGAFRGGGLLGGGNYSGVGNYSGGF